MTPIELSELAVTSAKAAEDCFREGDNVKAIALLKMAAELIQLAKQFERTNAFLSEEPTHD